MTGFPSNRTQPTCTAFDRTRRLAAGTYAHVALAAKGCMSSDAGASVLIFDDATGEQIDFDLRGSRDEIIAKLSKDYPLTAVIPLAGPGRPKLGVIAREVTLLPRHWDWLAEQSGGASAGLRKLVEQAKRPDQPDKHRLRKRQERTYRFMSAIAGNLPNFEEASRALFGSDVAALTERISQWPFDIREHVLDLYNNETPSVPANKSSTSA